MGVEARWIHPKRSEGRAPEVIETTLSPLAAKMPADKIRIPDSRGKVVDRSMPVSVRTASAVR
jgi:hypothetical protein